MGPDDAPQPIDQIASDLIRRKARKLVGRAGFTSQDREDLQQEFLVRVLPQLRAFDPRRGPVHAFVSTVIDNCAADLLRERLAQKRDYRRLRPLHKARAPDEEAADQRAAEPGQDAHDARLGRSPRSPEEKAQLASDVAEVLARLSPKDQDLARRLKQDSVSQVARDLGRSRSGVYANVRRLRQIFARAGLQDYL
jgi:RNA polymerase sigma-70 factor (ECF subfamily)